MITVNIPSVRSHVVHDRKFRPWQISGLAMWLDGADAASITLDGSNNVSQWSDKSGNGRHATQGTTLNKPSYTSGGMVNGIIVPSFNGVNHWMATSGATSISQPNTMIAATKVASGFINPPIFDSLSASRQYVSFSNATTVNAYANLQITGTVASITGRAAQCTAIFNGASSTLRFDRATVATGNVGTSTLGAEITVGSNRFQSALWKGEIAELLIYSKALSTTERDQVENYLATKWGTP